MTKDIVSKFGIDKCGVLAMKKGKEVEWNGIELQNGEELVRLWKKGVSTLVFWRKGIYVRRR